MAKEKQIGEVFLKNVRMSFPKLFKKEAATAEGTPKFGGAFLIDPGTSDGKMNIKKCKAALKEVMVDKWKKEVTLKQGRCMAFMDGDGCISDSTGEVYGGYEGMMVVNAKNGKRFPVIDRDKTPLTEEDDKIYGGCYVNAVVRFYAVDDKEKGGKGIFASLEAVQFKADGEAFGAAPIDVDSYFEDESFEDDGEEEEDDDEGLV